MIFSSCGALCFAVNLFIGAQPVSGLPHPPANLLAGIIWREWRSDQNQHALLKHVHHGCICLQHSPCVCLHVCLCLQSVLPHWALLSSLLVGLVPVVQGSSVLIVFTRVGRW